MANEHSVLSAAQVDELLLDSQRLRIEVKRLEGEKEILIIACGNAHSVGIEEAAKIAKDHIDDDAYDQIVPAILAAAKDTPTHRDGGDAKEQTDE